MGSFLSILSAVFTAVGTIFAKQWSVQGGAIVFTITMLFYMASSIIFPFALRHGPMASLATLSSIVSTVVFIILGLLVFREHISQIQALGIALAIVAVVLLSIPGQA